MNNADYIIFSDFDGTITNNDLLDIVVDHYFGEEKRKGVDQKVLNGELEHDKSLELIFADVKCDLDNAYDLIDKKSNNSVIDQHFKPFYQYCIDNRIDIYILSGGFKILITHYLPYVSPDIIFSNDVVIDKDNQWYPTFISKSGLDKVSFIKKLNTDNKKVIYIGDGTSDVHVIDHVDILLTKKSSILESYCIKNNIKHISFDNFDCVIEYIKKL